jgi:hypothetical protein
MKRKLVIVLLLLNVIPSIGQDIEKIIFTSQQADEPPTKLGRSKYQIEFTKQKNGDLLATDYYENKRGIKLKGELIITREQIETFKQWMKEGKNRFALSDLSLDTVTLKTHAGQQLNFEFPTNLVVVVDSFQFCQNYKLTKTISTGGEITTVTFVDNRGQREEINFDSGDIGEGKFKLKDYILCYSLLRDKIPHEIPYYTFFSKSKMIDIIFHYQKTIECEGYYYKEFTNQNPQMTSQEKRKMTGWDFVKYMEQRNKKQ